MAWLWWVGAALLLGVVETLTVDLTFLMFAGGALGGAVAGALGAPLWGQIVAFGVISTLLLVAVRPVARRRLQSTTPEMRTNAQAQIGREAVALTVVDLQGGRIRLGGEEWSARLADPRTQPQGPPGAVAARIETGAAVRVVGLDGATAVVVPA